MPVLRFAGRASTLYDEMTMKMLARSRENERLACMILKKFYLRVMSLTRRKEEKRKEEKERWWDRFGTRPREKGMGDGG